MATYTEIRDLFGDGDLLKKVEAAIAIAAEKIAAGNDDGAPFDQTAGAHDLRVKWAAAALQNTAQEAQRIYKIVLAKNAGATVANIQSATDEAIQSNVDASVDLIAKAVYGA